MMSKELDLLSPVKFIWKVKLKNAKLELSASGKYEFCVSSPRFSYNFDSNFPEWSLRLIFKDNLIQSRNIIFTVFYSYHLKNITFINVSHKLSLINKKNEKVYLQNFQSIENSKLRVPVCIVEHNLNNLMNLSNSELMEEELSFICELDINYSIPLKNKVYDNTIRVKEFDKFEKLLTNKDYSDVTITAEEKTFHAHKCVLAIRSPVFDAMFKHDMKEKNESALKIEDIRPEVLQKVLKFIYTGTVENINDMVCELLTAAEKYSLEGLKMLCQDTLCENFTKERALKFLCSADINNAKSAKLEAINFISSNLDYFLRNKEFKLFGEKNPKIMFKIMQASRDIDSSEEEVNDEKGVDNSEPPKKRKKQ